VNHKEEKINKYIAHRSQGALCESKARFAALSAGEHLTQRSIRFYISRMAGSVISQLL